VGARRTCRHHHPVQLVFADGRGNGPLGDVRAGEAFVRGEDNPRHRAGLVRELNRVDHAGDVGPAVADENTHPGRPTGIA